MTTNDNHIKHPGHAGRGHGPLLRGNRSLRKGRASIPHQIYFVTSATVARQRFFINFKAGCAAARCFEDKAVLGDATLLAWVLMPDHAHWLIQLGDTHMLDQVMNRIKSSSARRVNRVLNRIGQLWQKTYYDHAVREEEDLKGLARYMIANPLRANLVQHIYDYPFWNAVWV